MKQAPKFIEKSAITDLENNGGSYMRRSVKKLYAFLCMMAMFVVMIPLSAFAAGTDETRVAVSIKVPDEWSNPCVWAWNEDGTNAFDAWPGEECDGFLAW